MLLDKFVHQTLNRPYQLKVELRLGKGKPLLMLHGLNSNFTVWTDLARKIPESEYEFVAVDLLGFGKSPKPQWKNYDLSDHVESIVATMKKYKLKPPFTVVGHSMGSLITVELMKRYPELIERAVLVALPLYPTTKDLENTKFGKSDEKVRELYFKIYQNFADDKEGTLKLSKRFKGLTEKYGSFELNDENYHSFVRSLNNTIDNQNAFDELLNTKVRADIVYGRFDPLVIGKYIKYIAKHNSHVSRHTLNCSHDVTPSVTKKIAQVLDI